MTHSPHALAWVWPGASRVGSCVNSKLARYMFIVLAGANIQQTVWLTVWMKVGMKVPIGHNIERSVWMMARMLPAAIGRPCIIQTYWRLVSPVCWAVAKGSEYMGGVLYSALGKYDAPPTKEGRANSVAALKRVARRAADDGVTLGGCPHSCRMRVTVLPTQPSLTRRPLTVTAPPMLQDWRW
jgi:hypothetical protein